MTCQRAVDAVQPRRRRDVLPAEEKAHVIGGADRLDLAPQRAEREPVDAREHAPVAPLLDAPRKRPRSTWPSVSSRISARSTALASSASRAANASTVTGPLDSSQPRTISATASVASSGTGSAVATAAVSGCAIAAG